MKNGQTVAAFEREFASFVGAKYAIALANGTCTLHTALVALGVKPGHRVAVPPLTMSATTIAVLHAGAVPYFVDVDPRTWIMGYFGDATFPMPVSLYGLHQPWSGNMLVDDAAQTLRQYTNRLGGFVSYSFQASKILSLGEGGMLVTNDEALATRAREFSSLGYRMRADQPRIDPDALKSPAFDRHYSLGWNYRMADVVAEKAMSGLPDYPRDPMRQWDAFRESRQECASFYREAITGCDWLTPQYVPDGWEHDYWTFAVACDTRERALDLSAAIVKHGGERPFPCWRITYDEPAFKHLNPPYLHIYDGRDDGHHAGDFEPRAQMYPCPVAESLQPRLLQFQTNGIAAAEQNAAALRKAIEELS